MAFDAQGVLHLAYYDAEARTIRYASRSTSGAWSLSQGVDGTGHDVGAYLSIAVDPLGKPAIAYYDATAGDLVYSHFDGARWQRQVLDSKKVVGQFPSLAFDADGDPAVAYYRKTSGDLRLMSYDFDTDTWTRFSVDGTGDVGQYASLAVSDSGTVGIGYADATTGDLKYARWTGRGWAIETVDDLDGAAFISLAFDAFNRPAMSYYDVSPADLKLSSKSSGLWSSQTIGSNGAQGLFTHLWFDDQNAANLVYFNKSANSLFHLASTGGHCSAELIGAGGGRDASVAAAVDGARASYAWWRPEKNRLVTGDLA
jgi:hypothetical protein